MLKKEHIYLIMIFGLLGYFLYVIYPFYQRYWASCIDQVGGGCAPGKKYVKDLETIAYGLSFDDADKLATELKKPGNTPDRTIQFGNGIKIVVPSNIQEMPAELFKKIHTSNITF